MERDAALALLEAYEPTSAIIALSEAYYSCVQTLKAAKKKHTVLALSTYELLSRARRQPQAPEAIASLPLHLFFLRQQCAALIARHTKVLALEPGLAHELSHLQEQVRLVLAPLPKSYLEVFDRLLGLHAALKHMYTPPPSAAEALYRLQVLRPELSLLEELHGAALLLVEQLRGMDWLRSWDPRTGGPSVYEDIQQELSEMQEELELHYLLHSSS